jgi:hypothetical protein
MDVIAYGYGPALAVHPGLVAYIERAHARVTSAQA